MDDNFVKIVKDKVDLIGIKSEVEDILSHFKDIPELKQISLQAPVASSSIGKHWNCSVGRMTKLDEGEDRYIFPIFKKAVLINHYMESFDMHRTRIMISRPKQCYTIHHDCSPRIHIPVTSNPKCLMLIDSSSYYLAPGKIYWTDTRYPHTALNGSSDGSIRIHIVGCVSN